MKIEMEGTLTHSRRDPRCHSTRHRSLEATIHLMEVGVHQIISMEGKMAGF